MKKQTGIHIMSPYLPTGLAFLAEFVGDLASIQNGHYQKRVFRS
jgi:hypothetical protein